MKLIVKDVKLAQKAMRTNRPFTKGQIISGKQADLEVVYHACPEAFEAIGKSEPSVLPEKKEFTEKVEKRSDKKLKKFGKFKHKGW